LGGGVNSPHIESQHIQRVFALRGRIGAIDFGQIFGIQR
jgi:hypothetical protein